MAVEFVVEDGTGKINSNSYMTVADFQQYWTNRGVDYTTTADATIQAWLINATEFIDNYYRFSGEPSDYDTQALQWPRQYMRDAKGAEVASNTIPQALKDATARIAQQAKTNTDLFTQVNNGIKSKRVGPLAVTYSDGYKASFQVVDQLLKPFISNKAYLRANR